MARHRIKLAGVLVAMAGLYAAWLWARDSPVFAVEQVQISGLGGTSAGEVRSRLEQAARRMTTTHIDMGKLRAAISSSATVAALKVDTQFPHGLRIAVSEELPVMALNVGGRRLPVAPNGVLLRDRLAPATKIADVGASAAPTGGVLRDGAQLRALELLDIAPAALRGRISRVADAAQGLTAYLRSGPQLLFGDTSRLHAKWSAAARVLADSTSRGARYLDVRIPERAASQVGDPATLRPALIAGPTAGGGVGAAGGRAVSAP